MERNNSVWSFCTERDAPRVKLALFRWPVGHSATEQLPSKSTPIMDNFLRFLEQVAFRLALELPVLPVQCAAFTNNATEHGSVVKCVEGDSWNRANDL